ncbi:MAG: hypothetical protein ACAI35_24745 [Candidatus Methylacidiphilales bacterium]
MKFTHILPVAILSVAMLTGCATTGSTSNDNSGSTSQATLGGSQLNTAYALYLEQVKDQKRIDQIFITKSGSPDLRAITKDISTFSKAELETLKSYEKSGIRMNRTGLPTAEVQTRQTIEGIKTSQLLGSSGNTFRSRLLATEVEAVMYAQAIAKVIADAEKDPERKQHLAQSSRKWEEFGARLDALLSR